MRSMVEGAPSPHDRQEIKTRRARKGVAPNTSLRPFPSPSRGGTRARPAPQAPPRSLGGGPPEGWWRGPRARTDLREIRLPPCQRSPPPSTSLRLVPLPASGEENHPQNPFGLSLSKPCPSSFLLASENRAARTRREGFDKLSPNGVWNPARAPLWRARTGRGRPAGQPKRNANLNTVRAEPVEALSLFFLMACENRAARTRSAGLRQAQPERCVGSSQSASLA